MNVFKKALMMLTLGVGSLFIGASAADAQWGYRTYSYGYAPQYYNNYNYGSYYGSPYGYRSYNYGSPYGYRSYGYQPYGGNYYGGGGSGVYIGQGGIGIGF
ncbi:MAG TPA: hypothetical protein VGN57_18005 [Pirellulaceae bacterium]|jgi:hypothetical protein|nr:hypothetical protein [Pirellulaceae bacterium]